jgi:hypothetical protein
MSAFTMHLVSVTLLILVKVMVIYDHKIRRIPMCMARTSRDVGAPDRLDVILHPEQLIISLWYSLNFFGLGQGWWMLLRGVSSSSVCGAGRIQPNAVQPTEAYCANPAFGSPFQLQRRSTSDGVRPLLAKGRTMGKKWPIKFSLKNVTSMSM